MRVLAEGIRSAHTAVYVSSYCCIRVLAEGIRCLAVAYRGSTRLISRSHALLYPGACLLYLLLYVLLYCFPCCLADIAEARPPLSIQAPFAALRACAASKACGFTCCFTRSTCCFTRSTCCWLSRARKAASRAARCFARCGFTFSFLHFSFSKTQSTDQIYI